jgi:hypothetical protein
MSINKSVSKLENHIRDVKRKIAKKKKKKWGRKPCRWMIWVFGAQWKIPCNIENVFFHFVECKTSEWCWQISWCGMERRIFSFPRILWKKDEIFISWAFLNLYLPTTWEISSSGAFCVAFCGLSLVSEQKKRVDGGNLLRRWWN